MKSDPKDKKSEVSRVELKYCEHCGGLWLRECGAGVVYCPNCLPKVNDLPFSKKRPGRLTLPVRPRTVVESYDFDSADDGMDFEAAGGAA
jgi:hypothetical protein